MKTSRFRVVAAVFVLALVVGVVSGSETSVPRPDRQGGFTSAWRDGANVLRVQQCGPHFALLTIAPSRVVDTRTVTTRDASGAVVSERNLILVADEYGLSQLQQKPDGDWWDKVIGITRGLPRESLLPAIALPSADKGSKR